MAASFPSSIVCPVLIGRVPQLEAVVRLMEQARDGHGQTALVAGEAGIGKSRLITEAIRHLRLSHSPPANPAPLLLSGRCFEPDTLLPYAPLVDLLRAYLASRSPDELACDLGSIAAELVKLLPELVTLLPGLAPGPFLDPQQEQRRLFQALVQFFRRLSSTQPLLLIIEDVHWSDESSLEFLMHLARRIAPHPVLLLLSYRSEEVQPALARLLASLDRERLATEVVLTRLTLDEVRAMMRAMLALSYPIHGDMLETVAQLAEGNPFFIEELVKSLITAGQLVYADGRWRLDPRWADGGGLTPLPRSVQLAVQQRLDHLSPDARDLLSMAAVAGRRSDFALLQQLTQRDEAELVRLVKELITAQLVVEESADLFVFRHALTRQAVYTDLLARERRALHRSIAQSMERIYADELDVHLGDLAYHFYAAGEWTKLLEYAQRAGEKAQALSAPQAAIEHYTHTLEAAQRLAQTPPPGLYRARGQCYEVLGNFAAARDDYTCALKAARTAGDRTGEWQSLFDLGDLWTGLDYSQAGDYLHRALELARAMNDPVMLARTLNRIGNWHMNLEEPLDGQRYHLEALSIFQARSDQQGMAETLDYLGVASIMSGDLVASAEHYERAIALRRVLEDRQGLVSSLAFFSGRGGIYFTSTMVCLTTHGAECARDGEEAIALARQLGWRSGEAFALLFLGLGLGPRGEYARAFTSAEAGLAIAREIEHGPWMATGYLLLGILSLEVLALSTAQQHLEQALALAKECGSLFLLRDATAFLASAYIAQREFARAEAALDAAFGLQTPCQTVAQRLVWRARGTGTGSRASRPGS